MTRDFELKPVVRWSNGVAIRVADAKLLVDPMESNSAILDAFITHAHYDHSRAFQFPVLRKFSTLETRDLYEAATGREAGNWQQIRLGRRLKLGSLEVEAHDAGHILGSVQLEIITQDENLVYTSHLNFTDTLLTRAAEVAPCNTLLIEATFPTFSQRLPERESITAEIVKWVLECIHEHRVPALATESIGLAQELVRIFNTWTELPVVVHSRIARINQTYAKNGVQLRYSEAGTDNADAIIGDAKCVAIVPRRFDMTRFGEFRLAYVTSSPTLAERDAGKVFPLSDRADLDQLCSFVKEARPTMVLTFRGGANVLAELIHKRLGISAQVLQAEVRESPKSVQPLIDQESLSQCEGYMLGLIKEPNLTYGRQELASRAIRDGFKLHVAEEALIRLTGKKLLRYSGVTDGYSLP